MRKPKLSVAGQIEHLKNKGVGFTIMSEEQARNYLNKNNNFFKLTAYRKNYAQNSQDKYVGLEFAHLKDLAIIDMEVRYCLLHMCLDIEHYARVRLIKIIEHSSEDGYSVVQDFKTQQPDTYTEIINRAKRSPYCVELCNKYENDLPIWVFVEMLQFGNLVNFYRFVAERFSDGTMRDEYYLMQEVRQLRNACAHSNCILNDLQSKGRPAHRINAGLVNALTNIGISADTRNRKLSNDRIRQITVLLYFYKDFVTSGGVVKHRTEQLRKVFIQRMNKHIEYYQNVERVLTAFEFFRILVDKWYPVGV